MQTCKIWEDLDIFTIYYSCSKGRSSTAATQGVGGTLKETANEIDSRGGKGVPVVCDHTKDDQVKAVFDQIKSEHGKLDVLVNNAYSAVNVSGRDNFFLFDLTHDMPYLLTLKWSEKHGSLKPPFRTWKIV